MWTSESHWFQWSCSNLNYCEWEGTWVLCWSCALLVAPGPVSLLRSDSFKCWSEWQKGKAFPRQYRVQRRRAEVCNKSNRLMGRAVTLKHDKRSNPLKKLTWTQSQQEGHRSALTGGRNQPDTQWFCNCTSAFLCPPPKRLNSFFLFLQRFAVR